MSLRRWRIPGWEVPLVLLGIVLLSYGLWIPWMGLFGNDLPYLWYYHLLGPWGPGEFAAIDRPFSALFYAASTFLFGEAIWPYHVFLLLLHWLSAVLFWWVLRLVWPQRRREAALAALLFAVYPGFRQNPVALEFILHFFVLDLFMLSLAATLLIPTHPRRYWALAAASMLGTAGLFWLEYFIGLEILRPVFLWMVTRRQGLVGRKQWQRILTAWLPAVLVVLAFLIWRVFIFSFPTYQPVLLDQFRSQPLTALLSLVQVAAQDVWNALGRAWMQVLRLPGGNRSLLVFALLAGASLALVLLAWRRTEARWQEKDRKDEADGDGNPSYWGETALGIGLLAMLAGGSIFWLTGIPVALDFPWDRSTLSLMFGASLALTGLLEMLVRARYRLAAAALLAAMAVGMHYTNALEYRAEWQKLQDFAWQLTWRAPQMEPGTLLLFDVIPLNRYSDNDLTALLNWTYAPELHDRHIPYKFFDLTLRLDSEHAGLPGVTRDLPVESSQRGTSFRSTTSKMIALLYDPPACLKVLGPDDALLPGLPERIMQVLPVTSPQQILAGGLPPARPPVQLGAEPAHGWCYFFQSAELARQRGDWAAITALGDQAFGAELHPQAPAELLPFIEGYALTGNIDQASALTRQAAQQKRLRPALCALWQRVGKNDASQDVPAVLGEIDCQP